GAHGCSVGVFMPHLSRTFLVEAVISDTTSKEFQTHRGRHSTCRAHCEPSRLERSYTMLDKVCTKPVITASAQMTVSEAARAMRSKNIGALVVVNAGRPIGMLTDRDIAVDVVARGMDPDAVQVSDVMRKKPHTIRQELGLFD